MEEKEKKSTSVTYQSWDHFQRAVKAHQHIDSSPMKDAIYKLMEDVEEMLDGDNKSFDQNNYLKKKDELNKLLRMVETTQSKLAKAS